MRYPHTSRAIGAFFHQLFSRFRIVEDKNGSQPFY